MSAVKSKKRATKIKKKITKKKESEIQTNLLREAVKSVVGEEPVGIVDLLAGKKNVNEFTIAEKLKMTINQTRNILYKLSDEGLVSFVRKKDKKNGGWYTYFWTLETGKSLENLKTIFEDELNKVQNELERRRNERFYYSPEIDVEYTEEQALENGFVCPETGDVLELKDNSQLVVYLENRLKNLKEDLEVVREEYGKHVQKEDAAVMRKIRAEERKKKKEREERRKKRLQEKKRLEKKSGKTKKKTTKKKAKKKTARKVAKKKIKKKTAKKAVRKTAKKKTTRKKRRK